MRGQLMTYDLYHLALGKVKILVNGRGQSSTIHDDFIL